MIGSSLGEVVAYGPVPFALSIDGSRGWSPSSVHAASRWALNLDRVNGATGADVSRTFQAFAFARRQANAVTRVAGRTLGVLGVPALTGVWGLIMAQLRTLIGTRQVPQ